MIERILSRLSTWNRTGLIVIVGKMRVYVGPNLLLNIHSLQGRSLLHLTVPRVGKPGSPHTPSSFYLSLPSLFYTYTHTIQYGTSVLRSHTTLTTVCIINFRYPATRVMETLRSFRCDVPVGYGSVQLSSSHSNPLTGP